VLTYSTSDISKNPMEACPYSQAHNAHTCTCSSALCM